MHHSGGTTSSLRDSGDSFIVTAEVTGFVIMIDAGRTIARSRRVEWPTVGLAFIIYSAWGLLTLFHAAVPLWILIPNSISVNFFNPGLFVFAFSLNDLQVCVSLVIGPG